MIKRLTAERIEERACGRRGYVTAVTQGGAGGERGEEETSSLGGIRLGI
jgi:hypothetical protein